MSSEVTCCLMTLKATMQNSSSIKTIPNLKAQWHYSPFYHPLLLGTEERYGSWGRSAVGMGQGLTALKESHWITEQVSSKITRP